MTRSKASLAVLALLVFLLLPYRWALGQRARDTAAARNERQQAALISARINRAQSVRADPAGWAARVRATERAFPPAVDISGAVAELRAASSAAGTKIVSMSADPPAASSATAGPTRSGDGAPTAPTPQPVQLRIQVSGTISAIEAFLARLRSAGRLFTSSRETFDFGTDPRPDAVTADVTTQIWVLTRTAAS